MLCDIQNLRQRVAWANCRYWAPGKGGRYTASQARTKTLDFADRMNGDDVIMVVGSVAYLGPSRSKAFVGCGNALPAVKRNDLEAHDRLRDRIKRLENNTHGPLADDFQRHQKRKYGEAKGVWGRVEDIKNQRGRWLAALAVSLSSSLKVTHLGQLAPQPVLRQTSCCRPGLHFSFGIVRYRWRSGDYPGGASRRAFAQIF